MAVEVYLHEQRQQLARFVNVDPGRAGPLDDAVGQNAASLLATTRGAPSPSR